MGLPQGRLGEPVFQPTPTQGATMEYGGNAPTQTGQRQAVPGFTLMPESLPQFAPEEAKALQEQFRNRWIDRPKGPFGGGIF